MRASVVDSLVRRNETSWERYLEDQEMGKSSRPDWVERLSIAGFG